MNVREALVLMLKLLFSSRYVIPSVAGKTLFFMLYKAQTILPALSETNQNPVLQPYWGKWLALL